MIAEIVLKSRAIFTGTADRTLDGGIAVAANRIIAVEEGQGIEAYIGESTKVWDFGDQFVMAGFSDAHMHFFEGSMAASQYMYDELDRSVSEEDCIRMVVEYDRQNPGLERILATGWLLVNWETGELPSRKLLDEAFPEKPVYLLCADGHTFWLNGAALRECGITAETEVGFGEICKDEQGELTGILIEMEACGLAWNRIYEPEETVMREIQTDFTKKAARYGITSMCDMSSKTMPEEDYKLYRIACELSEEKKLLTRLHLYPSLGTGDDFSLQLALREKYHSGKVQVSGLKQFVDGVTTTYTAWMLEPYTDRPETCGEPNYPQEVYRNSILAANKAGFGVRLHTLGDASIHMALDIFEESNRLYGNSEIQNCLEHCESISEDDIERFGRLNVIPSAQPYHLIADAEEKLERVGLKRSQLEWPFKTLLKNGAILAFGTDYPVVSLNPFLEIYAAVTRCDESDNPIGVNPQERLTVAEALRGYTYGAACSHNRGHELGTLESGKLADIIVVDRNLMTVQARELLDAKVVFTMMDGQIVYAEPEDALL